MPGQGSRRQGYNPFETAITVDNVDVLEPVWTTIVGAEEPVQDPQIRPVPAGPPVVSSAGIVHVSTGDSLQLLDATTGARDTVLSDWSGAERRDLGLYTTSDGRFGFGARSGNFQQVTAWYDAGTGTQAVGPNVGSIGSLREPWIAGTSNFTDFAQGPGPVGVVFLRVGNLDDPSKGWVGRLVNGGGTGGLVLTDAAVIHAGPGIAAPDDSTVHNGVRSFALEGTATNCGSSYPDHACPQWFVPIDGVTAGPVALSDDDATAYFSTDAGTVYAVATADGTIRWSASVGAGNTLAPGLAEGTLLVPTASGSLVALDAAGCGSPTCSPLWTTAATGSALTQQPGGAGGVVFTGDADGTLAAYDIAGCGAAVCPPLWVDELGAGITGAPAISLGKVFVGVADGRVIAYAPEP
jgi:hypothetical protein